MEKKISIIGILTVIVYFISVGGFIVTQTGIALTMWEMMTIISGPVVFMVLLEFSHFFDTPDILRRAMTGFMSCVCALTGGTHIVNITVTRRLMLEGVEVPLYYQIGQWPSVEMAIDYLAWGFFMGLAFLCISIAKSNRKETKGMQILALIDGILCFTGFAGALLLNENLWYAAPMGYGLGLLILCIMRLRVKNDKPKVINANKER